MKALVFNCHFNGLSLIRDLGRRGIPVLALDARRSVGTRSRYACYWACPDPAVAETAFVEFLLSKGREFDEKPVLFPTNDPWAVAISRHKERLCEFYRPCVCDAPVIERVIEKARFYEWASARGYPVPRTWKADDLQGVPEDAFPLAAKPECRRTAGDDPARHERAMRMEPLRLTVLRSRRDLKAFAEHHADWLPFLLFQEYVEGRSDCMYTIGVYADHQHEVLGLFSGRKVRGFPPDIGDCIVGQVEAVPEELKVLVKSICREIGFSGIGEFEFKKDAVTGVFTLIEINPRSWSWVGITSACGVSLPWIAYCDLTGHEPVEYTESRCPDGSVKFVRLLADASNCLWNNRRVGFPEWQYTPRTWWRSLRAEKRVLAEFARDDLRPGFHAAGEMLRAGVGSLLRSAKRLEGRR